jgi:hypothetical protein
MAREQNSALFAKACRARTHACTHIRPYAPKTQIFRSANAVNPPATAAPMGAPFSIRRLTRQSCTRCARTQTGVRVVPSGGA